MVHIMDIVDMLGMMDMVDMVDMMDMVDVVIILMPGFAQDILVSLNWREIFFCLKNRISFGIISFNDLHQMILQKIDSFKKKH